MGVSVSFCREPANSASFSSSTMAPSRCGIPVSLILLCLPMALAEEAKFLASHVAGNNATLNAGSNATLNASSNATLNAAVHESTELGGYPLHAGWNCWIPGVVQGDAGFQSGVASPSACASACNSAGSWCVGFVFMHCQNKCWLRGAGVTCVTGQQAQCFDYYGTINHR